MNLRSASTLVVALGLTVIAGFLGLILGLIAVGVIVAFFWHGEVLSGKELVYVPLLGLTGYYVFKWTREAWSAWRKSRA